jgi:hypothetical protein
MKEKANEAIDDLFAKIRLKLLRLRESDLTTTEELKGLLTQLEDWVEKLVVDSLKLESLERKPKRVTKTDKKRQ